MQTFHNRLLVGSPGARPEIPLASINEACAACSDSFFISRRAADGASFSGLIGQRSALAIEAIADAALVELKSAGASEVALDPRGNHPRIEIETLRSFTFSVACLGFEDAEAAAGIGEISKVLVQEVSRRLPLSHLDGITFAADYASALHDLDRGDPSLGTDGTQPRDYGRPVAKCVRVVRAGEAKEHIVVDAILAVDLLGSDPERRACAIQLLVAMLAHAAHGPLYEAQLAKCPPPAFDGVARMVHSAVSTAPGKYFAARESAFADPNAGERYATLVRDSLASARNAVAEARLAYRVSADLPQLLDVATLQLSFLIGHTAEWLGHRDGLPPQETFPGSSLPDDLRAFDLHRWLELLGQDLRLLYDAPERFTNVNIIALGKHAERLLWPLQICPWLLPDGNAFVSVPIGEDESLLGSDQGAARSRLDR